MSVSFSSPKCPAQVSHRAKGTFTELPVWEAAGLQCTAQAAELSATSDSRRASGHVKVALCVRGTEINENPENKHVRNGTGKQALNTDQPLLPKELLSSLTLFAFISPLH